jgi:serine/threonine protein kinase
MASELGPGDPRRVGPYEITGVLGTGGMGRVYLARSAGGRPVAVKVIREELADDQEFRARFRREVAAARRVNGLFTAVVADADTDGPVPWLATAFVPGPTLAQAVTERGPLSAAAVRALAAGLAEGLAAVHAAGVVHRDLKPSNVLLAEDGPRLIDFGISRRTETGKLTSTGLVVGSPGFMSPEQAEGGVAGPPSDVFSLGAVLVYAATGHGPFGGGSTAALVYRVVHAEPEIDDVPETIRKLVGRCLAKNAAMRPSASELLNALSGAQPEPGWLPEQQPTPTEPAPVQVAEKPVEAARPGPKTVTSATSPPVLQETMPDTGLDMLDAVMSAPVSEAAPEAVAPTTFDVVMPQPGPVPPMPMPAEPRTPSPAQDVPMPWPGTGRPNPQQYIAPPPGPQQPPPQAGPGKSKNENENPDKKKNGRRLALAGGVVAVIVAVSLTMAFALTGGASTKTKGSVLSNSLLTPTRSAVQPSPSASQPSQASTSQRPQPTHSTKPRKNKVTHPRTSTTPGTTPTTAPAQARTTATQPSSTSTRAAKPKPKPKPTPTHSSSSHTSVPKDLGAPDFTSWCASQGDSVQLIAQNVSGWVCVTSIGTDTDIDVNEVCIHQYNDPYAEAEYSSYSNPNSWYCESS